MPKTDKQYEEQIREMLDDKADIHPDTVNILTAMPGWCINEKLAYLIRHVRSAKPQLAVEIGVFGGKSLCAIGSAMKLNGLGRAVGIDPWSVLDCVEDMHKPENVKWWTENSQLDEMYNQCLHYVATLGLKETVGIIRDQSQRAVTFFVDGSIDLLHIDGNHSAIPAMRDGQLYLPKVKPGGLIICDDEGWTERGADGVESLSVRPMIEWLKKNGCTEIEVGFGCSMLVKRIVA